MENLSDATPVEAQHASTPDEPAGAHSKTRFQALQDRARKTRDLLRERVERLPDAWARIKDRKALQNRAREARDLLRQRAERMPNMWGELKHRPLVGVGIAIGSGLGLAAMVGAAEAAVALSAGVLAYQTLTRPA